MTGARTVGLTGGIGSGKSTVCELLQRHGISSLDADAVSRALTASGGAAIPQIADAFGAGVLDASGALDRAAMRARVFADRAARRRLEAILHPRIRAECIAFARSEQGTPIRVLAIPLLFESGQLLDLVDRTVVVDLPEALQIERVRARSGLDETSVRRVIAAQMPRAMRLARADDVICNAYSCRELAGSVTLWVQRLS